MVPWSQQKPFTLLTHVYGTGVLPHCLLISSVLYRTPMHAKQRRHAHKYTHTHIYLSSYTVDDSHRSLHTASSPMQIGVLPDGQGFLAGNKCLTYWPNYICTSGFIEELLNNYILGQLAINQVYHVHHQLISDWVCNASTAKLACVPFVIKLSGYFTSWWDCARTVPCLCYVIHYICWHQTPHLWISYEYSYVKVAHDGWQSCSDTLFPRSMGHPTQKQTPPDQEPCDSFILKTWNFQNLKATSHLDICTE